MVGGVLAVLAGTDRQRSRAVDFFSGLTLGLNGDIGKHTPTVYLILPFEEAAGLLPLWEALRAAAEDGELVHLSELRFVNHRFVWWGNQPRRHGETVA